MGLLDPSGENYDAEQVQVSQAKKRAQEVPGELSRATEGTAARGRPLTGGEQFGGMDRKRSWTAAFLPRRTWAERKYGEEPRRIFLSQALIVRLY